MENIKTILEKKVRKAKIGEGQTLKFISYLLAAIVGLLFVLLLVEFRENKITTRAHNLNTFYLSQTCGDLPLASGTNESACQESIGEFMLRESRLFTR